MFRPHPYYLTEPPEPEYTSLVCAECGAPIIVGADYYKFGWSQPTIYCEGCVERARHIAEEDD